MAKGFRAWDDYFIPGTTILQNKVGITDAAQLRHFEEGAAEIRMAELAAHPIQRRFGYGHMKAIHRHIFQDVYEWAGQERVGPESRMTKDGPDVVNFAPGDPAAPTVVYGYYPGPGVAGAAATRTDRLAAVLDKALSPLPPSPRAHAQTVGQDRAIVDRTPRGVDAVLLVQGDFPKPATDAVRRTPATGTTPRRAGRHAQQDNSLGRGD